MQSFRTVQESPETSGARYIRKALPWVSEDHYEPYWAGFETEIVRPEGGLPDSSEMEILVIDLRVSQLMKDVIFLSHDFASILPGHSIGGWAFSDESALDKFNRLSEEWYNASRFMSSARDMAMLPSYQKIIGMGWTAVPFILRELDQRPTHWFWALRAITDVDPVDPENKGRVSLMASQWVEWGRNLRLI